MKIIKTNFNLKKIVDKDVLFFLDKKGLLKEYLFELDKFLTKEKGKDGSNRGLYYPLGIGSFFWRDSNGGHSFWSSVEREYYEFNSCQPKKVKAITYKDLWEIMENYNI